MFVTDKSPVAVVEIATDGPVTADDNVYPNCVAVGVNVTVGNVIALSTVKPPANVVTVFVDPIVTVPPDNWDDAIDTSPTPKAAPITIFPFTTFEPIDKAVVVAAVSNCGFITGDNTDVDDVSDDVNDKSVNLSEGVN